MTTDAEKMLYDKSGIRVIAFAVTNCVCSHFLFYFYFIFFHRI